MFGSGLQKNRVLQETGKSWTTFQVEQRPCFTHRTADGGESSPTKGTKGQNKVGNDGHGWPRQAAGGSLNRSRHPIVIVTSGAHRVVRLLTGLDDRRRLKVGHRIEVTRKRLPA